MRLHPSRSTSSAWEAVVVRQVRSASSRCHRHSPPAIELGDLGRIRLGLGRLSPGFGRSPLSHHHGLRGERVNVQFGPLSTYGTAALGQTTSLTGGTYTTVPRVVALIGGNGSVDTTTALTGVFNTNNARSVVTVNGTSFYVSGQGASKTDPTQGVFYATLGSTTATAIDNSTDTRAVEINNGTLYVSRDQNPPGSGGQNFTNVSSLVGPHGLPMSSAGLVATHIVPPASPLSLGGNNGSINLTAKTANGINNSRIGNFVYLSPEEFFFAKSRRALRRRQRSAEERQPQQGGARRGRPAEVGLDRGRLDFSITISTPVLASSTTPPPTQAILPLPASPAYSA